MSRATFVLLGMATLVACDADAPAEVHVVTGCSGYAARYLFTLEAGDTPLRATGLGFTGQPWQDKFGAAQAIDIDVPAHGAVTLSCVLEDAIGRGATSVGRGGEASVVIEVDLEDGARHIPAHLTWESSVTEMCITGVGSSCSVQ